MLVLFQQRKGLGKYMVADWAAAHLDMQGLAFEEGKQF
jgi:hypothetical protein